MATLKWTVTKAATEFGIHRTTLEKKLRVAGESPDEKETYTTAQIVRAIYGNEESERLRKITAEADLTEAKRKVIDREYVPLENALKAWEFIVVTFRQKILNCPELSELRRSEILEELRDIKKDEYFRESMVSADSADAETP